MIHLCAFLLKGLPPDDRIETWLVLGPAAVRSPLIVRMNIALDADHIRYGILEVPPSIRILISIIHSSAIDNATRGLMQLGQLPVTCGLFFSLGHSTIVVIFIIAIAISTNIFDKAGGFGDVGGIIGEEFDHLIQ